MNESGVVKTLLVRLPCDVKAWLEQEARRNLSSQTSEVVRAVRSRMDPRRGHDAAAKILKGCGDY